MDPKQYIKEIEKLKADAEKGIIAKLPAIEQQSYQMLLDWIDATLESKGGRLIATPESTGILNNFTENFMKVMQDLSDYKGSVSKYIKNLKPINQLITEFQKSQNVNIAKANITPVTEFVVNEILNMYLDNGLNSNFVQPLRDILFRNISSGASIKELKAQLKDFVISGKDVSGKLGRYITQTAQQGVDSYSGAINKKLLETFKYTHIIISGSLIATSSPQCRYAVDKLGGIIAQKDWPKVKEIAQRNGLIEGTNFTNLPFNKLHWGCRHEFTPVILDENDIKRIK